MPPLLSVKGLTLRRDDGEGSAIFNDISFDLEQGEVLILKGRSGCGSVVIDCSDAS
jgi:ABC-type dipeptide/oligopeptide/nickel transport system ATPase subunit